MFKFVSSVRGLFSRLVRERKGAALLEYALLIAGVSLMAMAAISIFGSKTGDLVAAVAAVLPGSAQVDNAPITVGHLIETTPGANGTPITVDTPTIQGRSGTSRFNRNFDGQSGVPLNVLINDITTAQ